MPDIEGDDRAARAYYIRELITYESLLHTRAYYIRLLPLYTMEIRWVQLCTVQKLRYLEIAHQCRAISRLRNGAAQS